MIEYKAVELDEFDFSPYGKAIRLEDADQHVVISSGSGWSGVFTRDPLLDTAGSLGFTVGDAAPCVTGAMERHFHTKEALFTSGKPVLLAVAATMGDEPAAGDVRVVILREGDLVILDEGIWHDACHGLGERSVYYWHAVCDPQIVDPWVPLRSGPVRLSY
jgi:ureidoglycolate lyase